MKKKPCKKCDHEISVRAMQCSYCGTISPTTTWKDRLIFTGAMIFVLFMLSGKYLNLDTGHATNYGIKNNSSTTNALNKIKSIDWVKDAVYQDYALIKWQVGIINNGRNPIWAASSICSLLSQYIIVDKNTSVRVVDIRMIANGKNFRESSLGIVNCSTQEKISP